MSEDLKVKWQELAGGFVAIDSDIAPGKMMSADALTYKGKVFAFFSTKGGREGLGCRLGRDMNVETLGLQDWQYLAPFKTKPPMKDWIVAGQQDLSLWPKLLELSLNLARTRND